MLPSNIEAERRLLALLLRHPDFVRAAVCEVWDSDFFVADHGAIFEVIAMLVHRERSASVRAIEGVVGFSCQWLLRARREIPDVELVLSIGREIRQKAVERQKVLPADELDPCVFEPSF